MKDDLFIEDSFGRLIPNPKYTSNKKDIKRDSLFIRDERGNLKPNPKFENKKDISDDRSL